MVQSPNSWEKKFNTTTATKQTKKISPQNPHGVGVEEITGDPAPDSHSCTNYQRGEIVLPLMGD